jgi:hypothetical protein
MAKMVTAIAGDLVPTFGTGPGAGSVSVLALSLRK